MYLGEKKGEEKAMSEENTSGWFEDQTETPEGKVAIDHQAAAKRAQIAASKLLTVPMQRSTTDKEITALPGWQATSSGYEFNKDVAEEHTAENYITFVLRGSIKGNHASLVLWVYNTDVQEIQEKQKKSAILEAKLAGYTVDDPKFITISQELHHILFKIRKLKKSLRPSVKNEVKLEDTFSDNGFEDDRNTRHQNWCKEFMTKANGVAEQVQKEYQTPTKSAQHKNTNSSPETSEELKID